MKRTNKINEYNIIPNLTDLISNGKILKEADMGEVEIMFLTKYKDIAIKFLNEMGRFMEDNCLNKKPSNYKLNVIINNIIYHAYYSEVSNMDCLDDILEDCKKFAKNSAFIENFKDSHNIKENPFQGAITTNPNMINNTVERNKYPDIIINNIISIIKLNRNGSFKLPQEIISILNTLPSKVDDELIDIIYNNKSCPYLISFDCNGYIVNESRPIYDIISYIENDSMSNYFKIELDDEQLYNIVDIVISNLPDVKLDVLKDEYVFNGHCTRHTKKKYNDKEIKDEGDE